MEIINKGTEVLVLVIRNTYAVNEQSDKASLPLRPFTLCFHERTYGEVVPFEQVMNDIQELTELGLTEAREYLNSNSTSHSSMSFHIDVAIDGKFYRQFGSSHNLTNYNSPTVTEFSASA